MSNKSKIDYRDRDIQANASLLDAFKKMDLLDKKLLVVLKDGQFQSLLSAGDIQRAIIKGLDLSTRLTEVLRPNIRYARIGDDFESIKSLMLKFRMEMCPVLDENDNLEDLFFWEDIFDKSQEIPKKPFNKDVVIMAGGFGTRMKPLTNVIPKPLIPVDERTIVEEIIDRFYQHGCSHFTLSVNYKADLIEYYLSSKNIPVEIKYLHEDRPLGTAGSLSLLKGKIKDTFFVTNCDILIKQDYAEILSYHQDNNHLITIVSSVRSIPIPYGTIETSENGKLIQMREKPEISFMINTGMYVIEPEVLESIPDNKFIHITDLIERVNHQKGRVGVFPVSEKSWMDIGNWNEYLKTFQ